MQSSRITMDRHKDGLVFKYQCAHENVRIRYGIGYRTCAKTGVKTIAATLSIEPVDQSRADWATYYNKNSRIIASALEVFLAGSGEYFSQSVRSDVAKVMMYITDKVCGGHSIDGSIC